TFTFYLTLNGGYLWVTDEADPEESELQAGDGLYVGTTLIKAFEINQGGLNEIQATDVVITEATTLEIKYGGKIITDWTLKEDSKIPQTALAGGKLSLEPATYEFYYNYVTKIMYVGKEGGTDPVEEHTGAYVIGGVETALTANANIADTADIELYATGVSLTAGQVLTFKADGKLLSAFYGNNCHGASVNEAAGTVTITKTGTFDIYLRHYDADDKGNAACWTIEVNNGEVYEALANTYYIVGGMNGWDLAEGCNLTESDGKYTLTIDLTNKVEFKVVLSDADGKFDWDTQKTYTLSSKVATTLTGGNIQITGGDGTYIITLSGTTVTVTKEGEEPDPSYEKDGVYVGDTLIQAFGEHNANEVKLVKVKFNAGDVLTFVHNGAVVSPKIKTGSGASTRIKSVGGKITCPDGGTFTIYYKFQGGDEGLWIVDEADEVESELQAGDGLIAGETVYEFQPHPDGTNEVKIVGAGDADIEFEEETSFTLKYAGQQVTDFT
ncbi:MAG: hypothetical protein K2M48_07170, partial [Clostridiales bacterium]|nr:hypothetical protein [Clostridiales bacterium]